jgi:hypothetical protein
MIDTPRLFEQKSNQVIRKVRIGLEGVKEFTATPNMVVNVECGDQN